MECVRNKLLLVITYVINDCSFRGLLVFLEVIKTKMITACNFTVLFKNTDTPSINSIKIYAYGNLRHISNIQFSELNDTLLTPLFIRLGLHGLSAVQVLVNELLL